MNKKALLFVSLGTVFAVGVTTVALSGLNQVQKINVTTAATGYSITFDYSSYVIDDGYTIALSSHTTKYTDPSMVYDFDSVDAGTNYFSSGSADFANETDNYICKLVGTGKYTNSAYMNLEFIFKEGPAHYTSGYAVFQKTGDPYSVHFTVDDYDDELDLNLFAGLAYGETTLILRSIVINYTC